MHVCRAGSTGRVGPDGKNSAAARKGSRWAGIRQYKDDCGPRNRQIVPVSHLDDRFNGRVLLNDIYTVFTFEAFDCQFILVGSSLLWGLVVIVIEDIPPGPLSWAA